MDNRTHENGGDPYTEIGLHRGCPHGGAVLKFHNDGMQWCNGCDEQVYGLGANLIRPVTWSHPGPDEVG
jgi:hypothetical protein